MVARAGVASISLIHFQFLDWQAVNSRHLGPVAPDVPGNAVRLPGTGNRADRFGLRLGVTYKDLAVLRLKDSLSTLPMPKHPKTVLSEDQFLAQRSKSHFVA